MLQGPKVLSMPWWIATHFVGSLNPGLRIGSLVVPLVACI